MNSPAMPPDKILVELDKTFNSLSNNRPALPSETRQLADREGSITVGCGEVLGHRGVHAEVLHQPDEQGGLPGVPAFQGKSVRPAWAFRWQGTSLHGLVHSFLGHCTIGGPFAPSNCDEI